MSNFIRINVGQSNDLVINTAQVKEIVPADRTNFGKVVLCDGTEFALVTPVNTSLTPYDDLVARMRAAGMQVA